jgi:type III restriction enzyme
VSGQFFASPILNSPYVEPSRHWRLDDGGQPTGIIEPTRRKSALVSPIPKPKKIKGKARHSPTCWPTIKGRNTIPPK